MPTALIIIMGLAYVTYVKAAYNWALHFGLFHPATENPDRGTEIPTDQESIQVALLLDTSNSMDGLIEQAKSQLWKIVGELSRAEQNGDTPLLQIALYEYGNTRLSSQSGYIRQVSPFTTDMDLISQKLFALRTSGGDEYCGHVIKTSLDELEWSSKDQELRLIYIAGNESFAQGNIPYTMSCKMATRKDIIINTIFCGDVEKGIQLNWKTGADLAKGNYMNIDHNQQTVYISSPYDDRISALNQQLNTTYIPFGKEGKSYVQNQRTQDANALSYSKSNEVERAVFKSSKNYSNEKWDLLDAYQKDKSILKEKSKLPEKYKGKEVDEIEVEISLKLKERENIKAEINTLNEQRRIYIKEQEKTQKDSVTLNNSVIKSLKKQAKGKGIKFKE